MNPRSHWNSHSAVSDSGSVQCISPMVLAYNTGELCTPFAHGLGAVPPPLPTSTSLKHSMLLQGCFSFPGTVPSNPCGISLSTGIMSKSFPLSVLVFLLRDPTCLACWLTPDSRAQYFDIGATRQQSAHLACGCDFSTDLAVPLKLGVYDLSDFHILGDFVTPSSCLL